MTLIDLLIHTDRDILVKLIKDKDTPYRPYRARPAKAKDYLNDISLDLSISVKYIKPHDNVLFIFV